MSTNMPPLVTAEASAPAEHALLRFATAGSVDDGKSTLIGRLLYDSKQIFDDQYEAIERSSRLRGDEYVNLALLTDGLRAEREQGITIDVAYRYFATPRRSFIIADTPGHVQYTRNMVTGASKAQLALVLVDARAGVLEQTRRHAFLSAMLRIPHMVLCVNKMDLVGYDEAVFERIAEEFREFARALEVPELTVVPISALNGDNVVDRSQNMPWYEGPTLLGHLEGVEVASDHDLERLRLPVQYVIRPQSAEHHDHRSYAGELAGGLLHPGDAVTLLPSGVRSTVQRLWSAGRPVEEAHPPMSVAVELSDDVDLSRGDLICRDAHPPREARGLEAMVCWMSERQTLRPGARFGIKHTTRSSRALVSELRYRLNVNTLDCETGAEELALNDIGRVALRTTAPLFVDSYAENRLTGSFILIDEPTGDTVGAGMILGPDEPFPASVPLDQ
ncbi:MAG: GTP-binding protein [Chloroflexi bacterium]|nr:GTP-binding protein [Chloroflexota bacterium]